MTDQTTTTTESNSTLRGDIHNAAKKATADITGILERFKLPGFDLDGFVQTRKLDIDAVTAATSAAFDGAQTIVDKQTELLKTVLTEVSDALRPETEGAAQPAEFLRRQQEFASTALSSALASMKEIADSVRESQSKILEIATSRVRSDVEEIRRLAKRTETEAK